MMAEPNGKRTDGAPPTHVHIEKKKVNWVAWIALILGILALLFALSRCSRDTKTVTTTNTVGNTTAPGAVVAETSGAPGSTVLAGTSGLSGYLAGPQPTPRTFTFEKLNFDTAKSTIRPADRDEVDSVAATLNTYGKARIRIAGYADTRGSDAANAKLGKARADAVKAALVAKGIDAGRIETVSGGENDPVDSNTTTSGRAENRRTELIVIQR